MVASMRKLKYILNRKNLTRIYSTYIRPILEYACEVWDNCTEQDCYRLELVQLEAARIVTGLTKFTSRESLYFETGWSPPEERWKVKKLVLYHNIVNGRCPSYLSDLLPPKVSQTSKYNLRGKNDLTVPFARTTAFQSSFMVNTTKCWNSLDMSVRNIDSVCKFKQFICPVIKEVPDYYDFGKRSLNIIHTRLRHNCSSLNADLFKVNLSDVLSCSCTSPCENTYHYFLECPNYSNQRYILFNSIASVGCKPDLKTILFGNNVLSTKDNITIFTSVHQYINLTQRFQIP